MCWTINVMATETDESVRDPSTKLDKILKEMRKDAKLAERNLFISIQTCSIDSQQAMVQMGAPNFLLDNFLGIKFRFIKLAAREEHLAVRRHHGSVRRVPSPHSKPLL